MSSIAINTYQPICFPSIFPKIRPKLLEFVFDLISGILFAVTHPTAVRDVLSNTVVDLLDAGAGPGTLEFQTSGAVPVATLTFNDPAFLNSASGISTANTITDDISAVGGTTDRFVAQDSNSLAVFLGSVGIAASGEDIELSSIGIGATDTVSVTSLNYAAPV